MADLTKIVGAVIAIAVSVIAWKGHICKPSGGLSNCDDPCSHHCGLYRRIRSSGRVCRPSWGNYRPEYRGSPHGCSQAHQRQVLNAAP